jgi:hypothetical protein
MQPSKKTEGRGIFVIYHPFTANVPLHAAW